MADKAKDAGVTKRAVLLVLLLILINHYWITVIEVHWYALALWGSLLLAMIEMILINILIRKQ